MAVSGRIQTDMPGSVDIGPAEDYKNECEPCLTMSQHKEAHGFCVPCQEYLCKICQDCHKRTKVSRNHQILGQHEFNQLQSKRKSNNECIEQCPIHQNEIIKFYCSRHSYLGCNDCMTIGHRACEIEYIPEKCASIADGEDYKHILMKLCEKLKEEEDVSKKAESISSDINHIDEEIIMKIEEFRAEINERLDQMQQDILKNVEGKKSNNKQLVRKVIDKCKNTVSDLKKLQSNLQANNSNKGNAQLYIGIKRAESTLKSEEIAESKDILMNVNYQYLFRRSADLEKLLTKEIVFGELINNIELEKTKKKNIIDQLTFKEYINVKTESDKTTCNITCCAALSSNKLVLADENNKKVKVVSIKNKNVLEEKILDSEPFDIAVMSENHFAVTIPEMRLIDVMTTDDKLSHVRSIKVDRICQGIEFHQDRLYVGCFNPPCAVVLTTQGNVLHKIPLNSLSSYSLPYIALRMDSDLLYISDYNNNSLVIISLQGDVIATYKHGDPQGPSGTCLLDDGSLLVCCQENGTIHHMKGDLKEGKLMYNGVAFPMSICYSRHNDEVYVGCLRDYKLHVLSTK